MSRSSRAIKAGAKVGQMLARMGQLSTRVVMENSGGKHSDSILAQAELLLDRRVEMLDGVVEPLAQTVAATQSRAIRCG